MHFVGSRKVVITGPNSCYVVLVVSVSEVAVDREVEGDLFLSDLGQGLFFRPGTFDGVIRCDRHVHIYTYITLSAYPFTHSSIHDPQIHLSFQLFNISR